MLYTIKTKQCLQLYVQYTTLSLLYVVLFPGKSIDSRPSPSSEQS